MPSNVATIIVTVLTILASSGTHAAHIYLYEGMNGNDGNTYYVDYDIPETQRCYSVPCFNDRTHSVGFRKLPTDSHIALYEDTGCMGKYFKVPVTPHGNYKGGFNFGVSSFMIWSKGIYPTNGLVNICKESTQLLGGNATDNECTE